MPAGQVTICRICGEEFDSYGCPELRLCRVCLALHKTDHRINWFATKLRQHIIRQHWSPRERWLRTRADQRRERVKLVPVEITLEVDA